MKISNDSDYHKKCILICAGELDTGKQHIERCGNDIVIAVDGGYDYCRELGIVPDILIGDLDSIRDTDSLKDMGCEVLRLPREKDDTDTIAAIRKGIELGCDEFILYGAMGGRIDHYFANIQALLFIKRHGANGRMLGSFGEIFIIENEIVSLGCRESGTVSLFVMGDIAEGVTITGLYYEVHGVELTNDYPIGISNEFCGREACISIEDGVLVCMISAGDSR